MANVFIMSEQMTRRNFPVKGMGCAACVARVEDTIKKVEGVQDCTVSLAANSAQVDFNPDICSAEKIRDAVQAAGYGLIIVDEEEKAEEEAEKASLQSYRSLKRDTIEAATLAVVIMIVSMALPAFQWKGWLLWVLASAAVFRCGRGFIRNAWVQIRHGALGMDSLVALSILISYFFSVFNLLFPQVWTDKGLEAHLYFESSSMIGAFILAGRLLEAKTKRSTTSSIRALIGLQPKHIDIAVGETFMVKPGDRIAADGVVVSGSSSVDESMLTGESIAVPKNAGDKVYTGTINNRGTLEVVAEKVGKDTMLSSIIKMVKDAQGSKADIQKTVDKVAAVFVPAIIGISVLTLVLWIVLDPADGVTHGLLSMVTVLVIACPCSLGLATPTALVAGIGNGARKGILIKDADALQVAGSIDTVVMDKTGTITKGISDTLSQDEIKETSAEAVAKLKAMGIKTVMLSGDRKERAERIAAQAGIGTVISEVMPGDKAEYIKQLQGQGHKVAMVGDGINDSAALALANLSIAMGHGSDIAINAAMTTIVSDDLTRIPQLLKLSRKTVRIVKQNLFWAFFYNALAVPIAAGVLYPINGFLLNPMIAAACMAMSSICVVANSLRLKKGLDQVSPSASQPLA